MWSKIVSIFSKVTEAVSKVDPYKVALLALVTAVVNGVIKARDIGVSKKLATSTVRESIPGVIDLFHIAGRPIEDTKLFTSGVNKILDGVIDVMNATNVKEPVV